MDEKKIKELLNRIGQGDDKAATELYRADSDLLYAFVRLNLPSDADADEVTTTTYQSVFATPDQFRGDSEFKTYLHRIARNKIADWWRANGHKKRASKKKNDPDSDKKSAKSDAGSKEPGPSPEASTGPVNELPDAAPNPEENGAADGGNDGPDTDKDSAESDAESNWRAARPGASAFDITQVPDPGATPEQLATAKELAKVLENCRQGLSDDHKDIIFWACYEQESVAQLSARLGIPPGTVKSRLSEARKNMQRCVQRHGWRKDDV